MFDSLGHQLNLLACWSQEISFGKRCIETSSTMLERSVKFCMVSIKWNKIAFAKRDRFGVNKAADLKMQKCFCSNEYFGNIDSAARRQ